MIKNYDTIDRWCFNTWGQQGEIWQQAEIGWLVKDYSDAIILILIWDK